MNAIFKNQIIKVLNTICRPGIVLDESTISLSDDLMERIIKYEIGTSIFWIVIGLITLLISVKIVLKILKIVKSKSTPIDDTKFILCIFAFILFITGIIIIIYQIYDIIKCIYIPETMIMFMINELNGGYR